MLFLKNNPKTKLFYFSNQNFNIPHDLCYSFYWITNLIRFLLYIYNNITNSNKKKIQKKTNLIFQIEFVWCFGMRSVLWNFPNRFNWHHQFSILHGLHCVIYIIETNCLFREFLSYIEGRFDKAYIHTTDVYKHLKLHKAFCSSTQTVLYPFLFITLLFTFLLHKTNFIFQCVIKKLQNWVK